MFTIFIFLQRHYAAKLYKSGDYCGAERVSKKILQQEPNNISSLTLLAKLAIFRKDWREAVARCEHICSLIDPAVNPLSLKAAAQLNFTRQKLASEFIGAGNFSAAESLLLQILGREPDTVAALTLLAEIATRQQDWQKAVDRWARVCESSPSLKAAAQLNFTRQKLASKFIGAGNFSAAESLLHQILGREPDTVAALTLLAEIATRQQDWQKAVDRWARVCASLDRSGELIANKVKIRLKEARINYSDELRDDENLPAAEALLQAVLIEEPLDFRAQIKLGEIFIKNRHFTRAVALYVKLLRLERRRLSSLLEQIAEAYRGKGCAELAYAITKAAALCGLAEPALVAQMIEENRQRGEWKSTAQDLLHILAVDPLPLSQTRTARLAVEVFRTTKLENQAETALKNSIKSVEKEGIPYDRLAILKEMARNLKHVGDIGKNISVDVSRHYYDDIYRKSPKYDADFQDSIYLPTWIKVLEIIMANKYNKLLDLGCGPGQFAEFLVSNTTNLTYTGVDFSRVAIDAAKLRCPSAEFINADIFSSKLYLNTDYQALLMLEVLEHVQNDLELFEKIPEGTRIIASVPNFDSFGHVRFFQNESAVSERYASFFSTLAIIPIALKNKSVLFVMHGTVK